MGNTNQGIPQMKGMVDMVFQLKVLEVNMLVLACSDTYYIIKSH